MAHVVDHEANDDARALDALIATLLDEDSDRGTRLDAVRRLAALKKLPIVAFVRIARIINARDSAVRRTATAILSKQADAESAAAAVRDPDALAVLVEALSGPDASAARAAALVLRLSGTASAYARLSQIIRTGDPRAKLYVIWTQRQIGADDDLALDIARALVDPDTKVCQAAYDAFRGGLSPKQAVAVLHAAAAVPEENAWQAIRRLKTSDLTVMNELATGLRDPDVQVRRVAARALGSARGDAVVDALAETARDQDPTVRVAALRSLQLLYYRGEARSVVALARGVSDPNGQVRAVAVDALLRRPIPDTDATQGLVAAIGQEDVSVRLSGIAVLGALLAATTPDHWDAAAVTAVVSAVADPDPGVRVAAVRALRGSTLDMAVHALLSALGDTDGTIRSEAAAALEGRRNACVIDQLLNATCDDLPEVRAAALNSLAGTDVESPAVIERARTAALTDSSPEVRRTSVRLLGSTTDATAIPALVDRLSQDGNADVRRGAALALARMDDEAAAAALAVALRDPDIQVAASAAKALSRSPVALTSPDPEVRLLALEQVLVQGQASEVRSEIQRMAFDPDENVRSLARLAPKYLTGEHELRRTREGKFVLEPRFRWRVDEDRLPTLGLGERDWMSEPPKRPGVSTRYVNTVLARAGATSPVLTDRPLDTATDYDLLINIGRRVEGSLLPPDEGFWPDELLPDEGLWLRAMLTLDGDAHPSIQPFFLPSQGESFACDCLPGGRHQQECAGRPWVRFSIHTPARAVVLRGELVIYYGVAAVHAQMLTLPVATGKPQGPQARLLGRLSRSFSDLGKLAGRTVSVVASPSRVIVNGISFADNPFAITARASDRAARRARELLYSAHFRVDDRGGEHSRYTRNYRKTVTAFEDDLRYLAEHGANLYARLFSPPGSDNVVGFSLPELLREEAERRQRPPVLQILDPAYDEHALLWAAVYDLPLGTDRRTYEMCQSVHDFGPGGSRVGVDPPARCPHEDEHDRLGDVVCPFGFWGLSGILEQPPAVGRDLESLVTTAAIPPSILLAADEQLDPTLATAHLTQLQSRLPSDAVVLAPVATESELADALAPDSMDVVYFYCHCGYKEQGSGEGPVERYLDFGDFYIGPLNVYRWARKTWPDPHWPRRHPLVVLNGCHTIERTSGTLNSFVPAFTQWAAAAGVLGTEVTMEQGLAGWVMEETLAALTGGATIGEAVRSMRWKLFGLGNIMGLAYTPYCLANLALRPPSRS